MKMGCENVKGVAESLVLSGPFLISHSWTRQEIDSKLPGSEKCRGNERKK